NDSNEINETNDNNFKEQNESSEINVINEVIIHFRIKDNLSIEAFYNQLHLKGKYT
ncbi:15442_t:CDS:1, partial [Funneliformis geosporum]